MPWRSPWLGLALLLFGAVYLFYSHLAAPVVSDEALYATVSRNIARGHDWFMLQFNGQPFYYKPPLHFWLGALSLRFWGESEWALRFPSATSGLFTLILIYAMGRRLFNHRTGLMATLIAGTTYNLLYLAHKGKMDLELGLLMNLGFTGFFLAFRNGGHRLSTLAMAFLAMAAATMLKGPIGILLPGAAGMIYLLAARRARVWRETPYLLAGSGLFLLMVVPYYRRLSPEFNRYFFTIENLDRLTEESLPALYYGYMFFVELLPWSLYLPCLAVCCWKMGILPREESDRAVVIWLAVFFVFLSLPTYKEEDFLVYLVPAAALLQARLWDRLWNAPSERFWAGPGIMIRFAAMLLASGFALALLVSPVVLRWRFPAFPDFLPLYFLLPALVICGGLIFAALRMHYRHILLWTAVLAALFAVALVHFFAPAAAQYNTSRLMAQDIRARIGQATFFLACVEGMSELLYYLDPPKPVPLIVNSDGIAAALRSPAPVYGLLRREQYAELLSAGSSPPSLLAEYRYAKWRYVLINNSPPH